MLVGVGGMLPNFQLSRESAHLPRYAAPDSGHGHAHARVSDRTSLLVGEEWGVEIPSAFSFDLV